MITTFLHPGILPGQLWSSWTMEAGVVLPIAAALVAYAIGLDRLWRSAGIGRGITRSQAHCFAAGVGVLVIAMISPLHALGGSLFSAHMTQHVLLMGVAAPLLVLGTPLTAFAWAFPRAGRRRLGRILTTPSARAAWRTCTRPSIAFALLAAAIWVWHEPSLYASSVSSDLVHAAQHASFLGTAVLFWWSLRKRSRAGTAVLYLFATAVHGSLLGALLTFSARPWYTPYIETASAWGLTPIEDQQIGGLIMWVPGGFIYVVAALYLFAGWLRASEKRGIHAVQPVSLALLLVLLAGCATTSRRAPATTSAFADADSVVTVPVLPGVTHTFVHESRGPWAIHVLEIDPEACTARVAARKPGNDLHARATTSDIAGDAVAAVNADFFALPRGTPVGAHVTAGVPLTGPSNMRPVFAVTAQGWRIGPARVEGQAHVRNDSTSVVQINRTTGASSPDGVMLFTSWIGDSVPRDTAAQRLTLRLIDGDEARGRAIVTATELATRAAALGDDGLVLHARGAAREWATRRASGDTVHWTARVEVNGVVALETVGGFPELIRDSRPVLAGQTISASFGPARHPRTAVGWTADDRLLLVVVDGRQPQWSAGMSLNELTWLFQRLGATHAVNLDGGGSTAMVVNGRVANRPSDREGERAVGNALVLTGCS